MKSSHLRSLCIESCPPFKEGCLLKHLNFNITSLAERGLFLKKDSLPIFKIKKFYAKIERIFVCYWGGIMVGAKLRGGQVRK